MAISIVFLQFGSAVGLSATAEIPWEAGNAYGRLIAVGLWLLWVQIMASLAGGYLAGRMRRPVTGSPSHEREMRDGAHGVLVWASGTVAVAIGLSIAGAVAALVPEQTAEAERVESIIRLQHNAAIIIAFSAAATSFVAGAISWWAATMGGEHRDDNIDHSHYVTFRKKVKG